ncbi:MAG TPA: DUF433 domain-containing protein [Actinomycetes bacterium]|nr:DUF433 domain-containing protein [Actinomycetes bacterium]
MLVPEKQAAAIAKITRRKLCYWHEVGLVKPSVSHRLGRKIVRLYTLDEVLQLRIAGWLRDTASLQEIRKIVRRQGVAYRSPLSTLGFARDDDGRIYVQHPDGTWETNEPRGQMVIEMAIPLDRFRADINTATARPARLHGRIEKRRGVLASKPVFAGTRVPVATVQAFLHRGYTTDEILREYPSLTAEDVDAARDRLAG